MNSIITICLFAAAIFGIIFLVLKISEYSKLSKQLVISKTHSLFILVVFINFLQTAWLGYYFWTLDTNWTILEIVMALLSPLFLLGLSILLFPTARDGEEKTNWRKFYSRQWPLLYIVLIFVLIASFLQYLLLLDMTIKYFVMHITVVVFALAFLLFGVKSRKAHRLFMAMQSIGWLVYFIILDSWILLSL